MRYSVAELDEADAVRVDLLEIKGDDKAIRETGGRIGGPPIPTLGERARHVYGFSAAMISSSLKLFLFTSLIFLSGESYYF